MTGITIQRDSRVLAALVETMDEGVTLSDAGGRFEVYNSKMEMITGYTREEAGNLVDLLLLLYQELARYRFAMSTVSRIYQRNGREKNTAIHAKDGTLKTLLVSTSVIGQRDEEFYLSVYRDITAEQQNTPAKGKNLSGTLPICSTCKKIRDDQGSWHRIESYITEHSDALFSHGMCPDCAKIHYPKYFGLSNQDER